MVIRAIGTVLSKINGMGRAGIIQRRQFLILGQSENFIAYKDILGKMSRNRMYTMAATAMSTVSMSIVGAYMTMLRLNMSWLRWCSTCSVPLLSCR